MTVANKFFKRLWAGNEELRNAIGLICLFLDKNTKLCELHIIFSCARSILLVQFILVPPHSGQVPTHFVCCGLATALQAAVG